MSYSQMILLTSAEPMDLGQIVEHLAGEFATQAEIVIHASTTADGSTFLELQKGDWSIAVSYESGDIVAEESQEIARLYAEFRPDRDEIAACRQRIDVVTTADPEMEHFNDFVLLLERLEKLPGAVLFDPENETFN
ncbi:hypothetical protein [Blastopirellula marina]|uniref:Uncharacterized protein n=1 Tax=Blastopirellula marina TaxID=124 RepID=A0A2S8GL05_9BACT|nr:hypothetical protein [Blastopirellula marina]PQO26639.1 hypothetical protein C5Y98_30125 [Blastopirellula marina]PQO45112.1 hypothetical protein C5Y93_16395 [Blastopirellula marina]PTL40950.1 hypothetical protein C5Y97_30140 [Blastopirellula marina]